MRAFALLSAALAVVPGVFATKSAIVYFEDKNTPDSVIDQAKKDIVADGGKITHSYSIIKYAIPSTNTSSDILTKKQGFRRRGTRRGAQ